MNRAFLHACCIALLTMSSVLACRGEANLAVRVLLAGAMLVAHLVLLQGTLNQMLQGAAVSMGPLLRVPGILLAGVAPAWLVGVGPLTCAITCIVAGGVLYAAGDAMRRADAALVAGVREWGC